MKPQTLYRSSNLATDDVNAYQGLKLIVDLRSEKEVQKAPHPENMPTQLYHAPMLVEHDQSKIDVLRLPKIEFLFQRYKTYPETLKNSVALILKNIVLLPAGEACAFHCTHGKDRTGFVSSVLLGLLGAPRDAIVTDYLHSADIWRTKLNRDESETPYFLTNGVPFIDVSIDALLEEYGSFREYAVSCVGSSDVIERVEIVLKTEL